MQRILLGKQQGLVFPVMCNAHIKIDYSDNIPDVEGDSLTSTDHPYGLWGHKGSFSFDAIITPYDVNGSGAQSTGSRDTSVHNSKKTMPSGSDNFTGVLVNEATIPNNNKKTIIVTGTDATTVFAVGDSVLDSDKNFIGHIDAVTSTLITLEANNATEVVNGEQLLNRAGDESTTYLNCESPNSSGSPTNIIRADHKMCLFHNTNLKIYLVNSSGSVLASSLWTSTTQNNPAAYKLQAILTTGSTTTTLTSDSAIISPSITQNILYDTDFQHGGMNRDGRFVKNYIDLLLSGADNRDGTFTASTASKYYLGQELFTLSGFDYTSLGTVTNISGSTITLSGTPASDISSQKIFEHAPKEATYVNNSYHIGVTFEEPSGKLALHFNGNEIKSVTHSDTNSFQLELEDCFIGANSSATFRSASSTSIVQSRAGNNEQFMGVLHELAMTSNSRSTFNSVGALTPFYDSTLLYLTFEEVDV